MRSSDPVRIDIGYSPGTRAAVRASESTLGVSLLGSIDHLDADVVAVSPDKSAAVMASLRALPTVRYVQLDGRAYAARTPNDSFWPDEWSEVRTHAPEAWDLTTGASSVVVAVVDTGIDSSQPDLAGRVLPGHDFVNGDEDASDDNAHGTAVAGVVAAAGDNEIGVAGYCWQCRLLPVKVLGSDGSGFNSWVAAGIVWAVDNGARVVNASLGSLTDDVILAAAAQYAVQHGVLVVAAAGNDGSATLRFPAALPGVVSVAASDPNDQLYDFSNTGATVAAPGENISTGINDSYVSFLGTSSAAPVVSGIAALAFAVAPATSAAGLTQALETSATPSPGSTYGRVDAYGTVHQLAPQLAPARAPAPAAPASTLPSGAAPAAAGTRVNLELKGRLTNSRRRRSYRLRTGEGQLLAQLIVGRSARASLQIRLLAPDGSTVARSSGAGSLRLSVTVDPARYRLVVGRRRSGRPIPYRLAIGFPAPSSPTP